MSGSMILAQSAQDIEFVALIINLFSLFVTIIVLIGWWKIFEKAGKPGWAAIIPIYNLIVLMQITGKPEWHVILMLIPCVNIFFFFGVCSSLARSFGKDTGYALGLFFLSGIFFPLLGFSEARYHGPQG